MTTACFDASAFVKLLVAEEGSDVAASTWDVCETITASRLAYPQVRAALAAARRAGRLDATALAVTERRWDDCWSQVRHVEVTAVIARSAGELAGEHALGGADAVHLASVLALGDTTVVFAVWDRRLRRGARAAGVRLAPGGPA